MKQSCQFVQSEDGHSIRGRASIRQLAGIGILREISRLPIAQFVADLRKKSVGADTLLS